MEELGKDPVFDSFSESNSREGSLRAGTLYGKESPAVARLLACPEDGNAIVGTPADGGHPDCTLISPTRSTETHCCPITSPKCLHPAMCLCVVLCVCICCACACCMFGSLACCANAGPMQTGLSTAEVAQRACEAQRDPLTSSAFPGWSAGPLQRPSYGTFNSASSFELSTVGKHLVLSVLTCTHAKDPSSPELLYDTSESNKHSLLVIPCAEA